MIDRIALDFVVRRRWPWFGLLFLLLACAVAAVVLFKWTVAREANATLEASIAQHDEVLRRQRAARLAAQSKPDPQAQLRRQAESIIAAQLDYPWNRVLADFEQAAANNVAVMALAIDQSASEIHVSVEARELQEILGMVDRLNGDDTPLWYLANYQAQPKNTPPTIRADIVKNIARK